MKAESLNVVVTGLCAHHIISSDMTDALQHMVDFGSSVFSFLDRP